MACKRLATWVLAPVALAAAPVSSASLSGAELERHCAAYANDPDAEGAAACIAFVQGFLAGADSAGRTQSVVGAPAEDAESSFAERAARTRVGSRLRSMQAERDGYCVDDSVSAAAVIELLVAHLDERVAGSDDVPAERIVHHALAENFPCDER